MSENVIGAIEGKATFEKVYVRPAEESDHVHVEGHYMESTTTYSAPPYQTYIGGVRLGDLDFEGEFTLLPEDEIDGWVWVVSTGDELHILKEEPEDG